VDLTLKVKTQYNPSYLRSAELRQCRAAIVNLSQIKQQQCVQNKL